MNCSINDANFLGVEIAKFDERPTKYRRTDNANRVTEGSVAADALQEKLAGIMPRCTTEQFWMVAAVTAFNAFLLTEKTTLTSDVTSARVAAFFVGVFAVYGTSFVLHRDRVHRYYSEIEKQLLDDKFGQTAVARDKANPSLGKQLKWSEIVENAPDSFAKSGHWAYAGAIVVGSSATLWSLLFA